MAAVPQVLEESGDSRGRRERDGGCDGRRQRGRPYGRGEGGGSSALDVGHESPDVASGESSPSFATVAALSSADPVVPVSLVKDEVKQKPDGPKDASSGTSTQSGTGDVSRTQRAPCLSSYRPS